VLEKELLIGVLSLVLTHLLRAIVVGECLVVQVMFLLDQQISELKLLVRLVEVVVGTVANLMLV
jgi:hypothetical protein